MPPKVSAPELTLHFKFGKTTLFWACSSSQITLNQIKSKFLEAVAASKAHLPHSSSSREDDESMNGDDDDQPAPANARFYREVRVGKWEVLDSSDSLSDLGLKNGSVIGISWPDARGKFGEPEVEYPAE